MDGHNRLQAGTSGENRGQTLIDYIAGVAVFFVTITFILGLLPSFVTPYQSDVAGQDTAQAERIAEQLVTNVSVEGSPGRLNVSQLETILSLPGTDVATRYGLRDHRNVNITVNYLNGSGFVRNATAPGGINLTSSVTYEGQTSATAVRIVTLNNESATCSPACRLLVRVW